MHVPDVLLAKGCTDPSAPTRGETLLGHLENVAGTTDALLECVGNKALEILALSDALQEELKQAAERAALLHDLGKANDQFQRMVSEPNSPPQALRHEWISAWMVLVSNELGEWLFEACSEEVRYAALFAVLGHHLKVDSGSSIAPRPGSEGRYVTLFTQHPGFRSCLELARESLGLSSPPSLAELGVDLIDQPLTELRRWLVPALDWYERADEDTQRFVALVKALLIAADVAGSAVPKLGINAAEWTREVLGRVCIEDDFLGVANTRLNGHHPRPFQTAMARAESRCTFARAGCGSGKTVGAYLWAAKWARGSRLFLSYPTTGTATEGYRDYIIPDEIRDDSALLHSRSQVDLEMIFEEPEKTEADSLVEGSIRIESLAAWDVPLVICTADQVLGLIQNNRRALFALPAICKAAFVFDEIHQYDDELFGALLRFIETFRNAPTLLMTASLPEPRLRALNESMAKTGGRLQVIEGPPELEGIKRYTLNGPTSNPPWEMVEQALAVGQKVLWVANTVDRAISFADTAQQKGLSPVLPYHSRYRYCDRVKKHAAVVEAFRRSGPALAVTTQVCECSLDLSSDLLVSDLAPAAALIQRLGRLNRRITPGCPGSSKPAFFIQPSNPKPYKESELEAAQEWLNLLGNAEVSQSDLDAAFKQVVASDSVPEVESAWLDGGPLSKNAPLRGAGTTIPIIRAEDWPLCVDKKRRPIFSELARFSVPMPLRPVAAEIGGWKRLGYVFVAPVGRIDYSEERGAKWAKR